MDEPPAPPSAVRWRVQTLALTVLATVSVVAVAKWAAEFLVPVVAGMMLAYALQPVVRRLTEWKVPRAIAATLVLAALIAGLAGAAYGLRHQAADALAELPEAARRIREALHDTSGESANPIAHVQKAARELDKAAAEAAGAEVAPAPKAAATAAPAAPVTAQVTKSIAVQGAALLGNLAQIAIALTLAFFLLTGGDAFRRKIVHLVGPSLAKRRVTVEILDEIDVQVQRYLLNMLVTNVILGFACWGAYTLLGLDRAALWGAVAGILHFVPYVGPAIATVVVAIGAILQSGSIALAIGAAASTVGISIVLGMGLQTWLQGRMSRMNPVAVFVSVLFFGWLWGGWGLLLGAPLAAIAKTVAERIDYLYGVGELLGDSSPRPASAAAQKDAEQRGA